MSVTDPISDYVTRIRNAQKALHETVVIPHSKLKESITSVLQEEGYIQGFKLEMKDSFPHINISLKYEANREPAIRRVQRVSRPGRRVYIQRDDIRPVLGGLGILVISTSKGILTGKAARRQGLGGEVLLEIY